jgi:formamidopyrimidine-DNA glycosylase
VTFHENLMRGVGITAQRKRQTHCIHGHPFDEENTVYVRKGRACRICTRRNQRLADAKRSPRHHK